MKADIYVCVCVYKIYILYLKKSASYALNNSKNETQFKVFLCRLQKKFPQMWICEVETLCLGNKDTVLLGNMWK